METTFDDEWNTIVFENADDFSCTYAVIVASQLSIFESLSEWRSSFFKEPMVLYFEHPYLQHFVNFKFTFKVDVILVNVDGTVENTFTENFSDSKGSYIRGFSSNRMVILCPENFIMNNNIIKQKTRVELVAYYVYSWDIENQIFVKEKTKLSNGELKWRIGRHRKCLN